MIYEFKKGWVSPPLRHCDQHQPPSGMERPRGDTSKCLTSTEKNSPVRDRQVRD